MAEDLKFIRKPIYETLPPAVTNLFSNFNDTSICIRNFYIPRMKVIPNSEYLSKSIIHCLLHLYRLLPATIRALNPKKFSKQIYEYMRLNWDPQSIPYK